MNSLFLTKTLLFSGTNEKEAEEILHCLGSYTRTYEKGEVIYRIGEVIQNMGLVLSGSVTVENDDIWGNKSILNYVEAGQIFAETYASIPGEALMVNVIAIEKTEILFLNVSRILRTCSKSCEHHNKLITNLLQITAQKNLGLSRHILHISPKSIRGRLLSYFSQMAIQSGSYQFTIPFNRQQLADYLGVDRSALSNELSKMQADGLLSYKKNNFVIKETLS